MERYLLPAEPVTSLASYLDTGGGLGVERAVELGPQRTIDEVTASGLRGRGGGGFPTGRKWAGVRGTGRGVTYVVANGAEGEPATFKDRALLRANPYQVVEGVVIAAFAVGAEAAFIALKGSFEAERAAVERATAELQDAGICRDCAITLVAGPDEYLYGEEKALLEVIEGRPPLPRNLPPYEHGLFATDVNIGWESGSALTDRRGGANPTVVNNVETLAHVTHVLANGADWFRSSGTEESPGHAIATVVGDVTTPGVAEVELGRTLRSVIDDVGGGVAPGRAVKAVLSGVANPVVVAEHLDVPLTYEGFRSIGSGMGALGFSVYDDTACMVEVARQVSRFLWIESCGQCPACKLGSEAITELLARLEVGAADPSVLDDLAGWLRKVTDANRCYLAVQEQVVVASLLQGFPDEVAEHLAGPCPRPRTVIFPKLVDLTDGGTVVVDDTHHRKQPDWTYR